MIDYCFGLQNCLKGIFAAWQSCECETLQAEVISLKQQLSDVLEFSNVHPSLGKSSKPSRMPSTSAGVEKNEETVLLDDTSSKRLLLHAQVSQTLLHYCIYGNTRFLLLPL